MRLPRCDEPKIRAAARIFGLTGFVLIVACSPASSRLPDAGTPGPSLGISIPTYQLPADTRCMVENGFRLVAVLPPAIEGEPPGYKLESDLPPDQLAAIVDKCQKLAPVQAEKTVAELRVIYDRWVGERGCLAELGYEPGEPPSFETFQSEWKTGPWMPIDGVDTGSWTDLEYTEAKERCTLEMFSRG